jgi:hypothetical protein
LKDVKEVGKIFFHEQRPNVLIYPEQGKEMAANMSTLYVPRYVGVRVFYRFGTHEYKYCSIYSIVVTDKHEVFKSQDDEWTED